MIYWVWLRIDCCNSKLILYNLCKMVCIFGMRHVIHSKKVVSSQSPNVFNPFEFSKMMILINFFDLFFKDFS